MEKTVGFKIRVPQAGRWEDTPIYRSKTLNSTKDEISHEAQEIAEGIAFNQCSDVRWNYEGSTHEHYVGEVFPEKEMASTKSLSSLMPGSKGGSGVAICLTPHLISRKRERTKSKAGAAGKFCVAPAYFNPIQSRCVAGILTNQPCGEKPSQGFFRAEARGDKRS